MDPTFAGYLVLSLATLAAAVIAARAARQGSRKGDRNAQHLEDLITWSHIHHEQDNEVRTALGIKTADYPDLVAWRNRR